MVAEYRERLVQAMRFQDLQTLAELVFEIKSVNLDEKIDVTEAEDLIFAD